MKNNYCIISKDNLYTLLRSLSEEADVYIPIEKNGHLHYEKFNPESKEDYVIDQIRASEPLKSFLATSRERVDNAAGLLEKKRQQVLVGVKNCDMTSLKIQDFVFSQTEPKDPFYIKKREETTIISCDCSKLWDSCFCVALDIDPYPEKGFDLNLTKYGEDFIVEVGSDKGGKLVDDNKSLFSQADEAKLKKRASARESFKNSLKSQVRERETPHREAILGSVKKSYNDEKLWEHFASTCIECGGCNHCCPTCHCFSLSDEKKGDIKARYKTWDACLYNRFAKVAGGASPRPHLYERLRNRFDKKFEFFQNVLGMFACTGCGRCTEVCPGKIDIREVLKSTIKCK